MVTNTPIKGVLCAYDGTLIERKGGVLVDRVRAVLAATGRTPDPAILGRWCHDFDGASHAHASTDRAAYEQWVIQQIYRLLGSLQITTRSHASLGDAIAAIVDGAGQPFPEAFSGLRSLAEAGIVTAIVANGGWDLSERAHAAGFTSDLVGSTVSSARIGARKPNARAYTVGLEALGLRASQVCFVGDNWGHDVLAPLAFGMKAIHIWRPDVYPGSGPPPGRPGVARVADLNEAVDQIVA